MLYHIFKFLKYIKFKIIIKKNSYFDKGYYLDKYKNTFKHNILFSRREYWNQIISIILNENIFVASNEFDNSIDYEKFDLIMPLTIEDSIFLNNNYSNLNNKKFILSSNKVINICNNKKYFNDFLIKNGYKDYIPKIDNLTFPYILKKNINENGVNSFIINNKSEEEKYKIFFESKEYFKQEYIDERVEYATHIFFYKNKIIFAKTKKYIFYSKFYIKGKDCKPTIHYFLKENPFLNIFESILSNLDYQGMCCFNYAIVNNKLKIFELNPRIGVSIVFNMPALIKIYKDILI